MRISDKRDTANVDPIPLKPNHERMRLVWDIDGHYGKYDEDRPTRLQGISEVVFPARYEVCSVCEGKGRYVNPDIDRNGLNPDEYDYDFMEQYMGGVYDITCKRCGGDRVTLEIWNGVINSESELDLYQLYKDELKAAWESIAESAHIQRMESGGY